MSRKSRGGAARAARSWLPIVTVAAAACVAVLAFLCYLSMQDIQRGLLATVAKQQDEYVDLVVGQIGLHNESDDGAVINDILGVIDDSSGQYWTFSKDGSLLFVRDAAESDKYRGMPVSQYFDEAGAQDFYDGLSADETTHAHLSLDGRDYIASGRSFDYDGSTYRLCLLTSESAVLDDNQILGARSRLAALVGIESALLLFSAIWLAARRDAAARQLSQARGEVASLTVTVERLNGRIARDQLYRLDGDLWSGDALADFEGSLRRRHATGWLAGLAFANGDDQESFVRRAKVLLGTEVPRFDCAAGGAADDGGHQAAGFADVGAPSVCVLFVRQDKDEAARLLSEVLAGLHAQVSWRQVGDVASTPADGSGPASGAPAVGTAGERPADTTTEEAE